MFDIVSSGPGDFICFLWPSPAGLKILAF